MKKTATPIVAGVFFFFLKKCTSANYGEIEDLFCFVLFFFVFLTKLCAVLQSLVLTGFIHVSVRRLSQLCGTQDFIEPSISASCVWYFGRACYTRGFYIIR